MNSLVLHTEQFEGKRLNTIMFHDRPCWVASDLGEMLGYSKKGQKMLDLMSEEWKEEFIDGHDYTVLTGDDLEDFRRLMDFEGTDYGPANFSPKTRRLTILFESGLHIACLKTNKDVGKKLRRFLAEHVLPQLTRKLPPSTDTDPKAVAAQREQRGREYMAMLDRLVQAKILPQAEAHGLAQVAFPNYFEDAVRLPSVGNGQVMVHFTGKPLSAEWALFKLGHEYGFKGVTADYVKAYEAFIRSRYPDGSVGGAKLCMRVAKGPLYPFREPHWRWPESLHRLLLPQFIATIPVKEED